MIEENLKPPHGHEILWQEIEHIGIHPNAAKAQSSCKKKQGQQNPPPPGKIFV
jgi:hypothetical protein